MPHHFRPEVIFNKAELATGAAPSSARDRSRRLAARDQPLVAPLNAWRILQNRTGGEVSRATFYRWLANGRLYSVRLGFRLFVPLKALDELIQRCLKGES